MIRHNLPQGILHSSESFATTPSRNLIAHSSPLFLLSPLIDALPLPAGLLYIFKRMDVILQELQCKKCWKSFMKTQCRRNKIAPTLANTFTIVKMRKFYEKLASTYLPAKEGRRLASSE